MQGDGREKNIMNKKKQTHTDKNNYSHYSAHLYFESGTLNEYDNNIIAKNHSRYKFTENKII